MLQIADMSRAHPYGTRQFSETQTLGKPLAPGVFPHRPPVGFLAIAPTPFALHRNNVSGRLDKSQDPRIFPLSPGAAPRRAREDHDQPLDLHSVKMQFRESIQTISNTGRAEAWESFNALLAHCHALRAMLRKLIPSEAALQVMLDYGDAGAVDESSRDRLSGRRRSACASEGPVTVIEGFRWQGDPEQGCALCHLSPNLCQCALWEALAGERPRPWPEDQP